MTSKVVDLAYEGKWRELLHYLERQPHLVNAVSAKGYTPLHQAAWHGASRQVVGALLALGADTSARTMNRDQSAVDIAIEKHPGREDLRFLMREGGRTPSQLLRKLVADQPKLFQAYDGNRLLCDRVVECLYSGDRQRMETDIGATLLTALRAAAGARFFTLSDIEVCGAPIDMRAASSLWIDTIIPAVTELSSRTHSIALAPSYAVMADLFDPLPFQWGLRGDPFLWFEMSHALCHTPLADDDSTVERILLACFTSLTGTELSRNRNLSIARFARGGMSSGMICGETWTLTLIPTLRQRADWLRDAWSIVPQQL
jgi:hypothetical protein